MLIVSFFLNTEVCKSFLQECVTHRGTFVTKKMRAYSNMKLYKFDEKDLRTKMKTEEKYKFFPMENNKIKSPKAILLDYDNTLVDSWPQDFITSNKALIALGLPPMTPTEMLTQPHIPATQALALYSKKSVEEVEKIYFPIYYKHHRKPAPPVPGAFELISYLKEQGIYVAIISNKEQSLLDNTIEQIGWKNYFNSVIGARTNEPSKPSPSVIVKATKDICIKDKRQIWLAGDALLTDILCAVNGNITPVWVSNYSVDQLNFSVGGIPIIHALDCYHLREIIDKSIKNYLSSE